MRGRYPGTEQCPLAWIVEKKIVGLEIFTAVVMKSIIFWDVTLPAYLLVLA
jgi:hypothetical protein